MAPGSICCRRICNTTMSPMATLSAAFSPIALTVGQLIKPVTCICGLPACSCRIDSVLSVEPSETITIWHFAAGYSSSSRLRNFRSNTACSLSHRHHDRNRRLNETSPHWPRTPLGSQPQPARITHVGVCNHDDGQPEHPGHFAPGPAAQS